jgi:tetratricopeptide (TPR) repeat protein
MHQEVARALEAQYSSRRDEHAAELAEHFGQSTDRADLAKAVEYSELAAKRAMAVFAHAEAESHLKRCLEVQQVLDPDDKARRCDLLLMLGDTILPQAAPVRLAQVSGGEAFSLAEELDDPARAVRAAIQVLEALSRSRLLGTSDFGLWVERADRYARPATAERVRADIALSQSSMAEVRLADGGKYLRRALNLAETLADSSVFFAAAAHVSNNLRALRDRPLVEDLARRVMNTPRDGGVSADIGICLHTTGQVLLETGDRPGAEAAWRELRDLAVRSSDEPLLALNKITSNTFVFMDGRLDEMASLAESDQEFASAAGIPFVGNPGFGCGLAAMLHLGRDDDIGRAMPPTLAAVIEGRAPLESLVGAMRRFSRTLQAILLSRAGEVEKAQAIFQAFEGYDSDEDESNWIFLVNLLHAAVAGGLKEPAQALRRRLSPLSGELSIAQGVSIGRLLGEASILLGEPTVARDHYARGLDVCQKVRFRPEIALIRLDLAELLLDHYPDEHDAAIEHLDFAIAEFREMKMQPALERALGRRGLLKA